MIHYQIVNKTFLYSKYLIEPMNDILKNIEMDELTPLLNKNNYKYQRIFMGIRLNFIDNEINVKQ